MSRMTNRFQQALNQRVLARGLVLDNTDANRIKIYNSPELKQSIFDMYLKFVLQRNIALEHGTTPYVVRKIVQEMIDEHDKMAYRRYRVENFNMESENIEILEPVKIKGSETFIQMYGEDEMYKMIRLYEGDRNRYELLPFKVVLPLIFRRYNIKTSDMIRTIMLEIGYTTPLN
jgi:hypothetical protein